MSYTDQLGDVDRALKLFHEYSIEPASQPVGYSRGKTFEHNSADFAGFRHEVVDSSMRKAWVELNRNTSHAIRVGGTGAFGSLQITASIEPKYSWAPTYYLPWDHRGAAVEMTIPSSTSTDLSVHPQIFFTTALSGCSVIFKGTADNPTVYHCGSQDKAIPYDANQFWEDFVKHIDATQSRATPGSRFDRPIASQAKKSQYVSGVVDPDAPPMPGSKTGNLTTQSTLDFRKSTQTQYGNSIAIQQMIPWGAVVGIRRGTRWTFYLQENVNLVYYTQRQVQIAKQYLGRRITGRWKTVWEKLETTPKIVSLPMVVREVFPSGNGVPMTHPGYRLFNPEGNL